MNPYPFSKMSANSWLAGGGRGMKLFPWHPPFKKSQPCAVNSDIPSQTSGKYHVDHTQKKRCTHQQIVTFVYIYASNIELKWFITGTNEPEKKSNSLRRGQTLISVDISPHPSPYPDMVRNSCIILWEGTNKNISWMRFWD